MLNVGAVILDMDGLLLNTERLSMRAWQAGALDLGIVVPDALFIDMIGHREADCVNILVKAFGPDTPGGAIAQRTAVHYHRMITEAPLPVMPGVFDLLDLLDTLNIPRGVGTSTHTDKARFKLESAGILPRVMTVVGGDQATFGKPAPDIFLKVAQQLGVEPPRCLVFEDSGPGVRAARAAGMTPILVPDLKPPTEEIRSLSHKIFPSLTAFLDDLKAGRTTITL